MFTLTLIIIASQLLLARGCVVSVVPPTGTPPVHAIRPGLDLTRKIKGRYPSGFA